MRVWACWVRGTRRCAHFEQQTAELERGLEQRHRQLGRKSAVSQREGQEKLAEFQHAGKVGASGTKVDAKAVMWQKYPFLLLRDTRKPLASALKSGARQVSTLEGEKLLV